MSSSKQAKSFMSFFKPKKAEEGSQPADAPAKTVEEKEGNTEEKENRKRPLEESSKVPAGKGVSRKEQEEVEAMLLEMEEEEEETKRPPKKIRRVVDSDSDSDEDVVTVVAGEAPPVVATAVTMPLPVTKAVTSPAKKSGSPAKEKREEKGEEGNKALEAAAVESAKPKVPSMFHVEPKASKEKKEKSAPKDSEGKKSKKDKDSDEEDEEEGGAAAASLPSDYDPTQGISWKQGKPVPYSALADVFQKIEDESGRLKIQGLLCGLLRSVICTTPGDLIPLIYLSSNCLTPAYEGVELGIGDSIISKAICQSTGRNAKVVAEEYTKLGDLGLVAQNSRAKQSTMFKPQPLTVRGVYENLMTIAKIEGSKSQDKKIGIIQKLLVSCNGNEAKYIVRLLQGKLRIGLAAKTVLVAIAHAVTLTPPSTTLPPSVLDIRKKKGVSTEKAVELMDKNVKIFKQVFSELPSYDIVIKNLVEFGIDELSKHCCLQPGVPVAPMLAKPTTGVSVVLDRFAGIEFTCEYKYDGERAQVHLLDDGSFKIYSRNSENNTGKFPDLIKFLPETYDKSKVTSFVIDSEVVAWDTEKKCLMPFQVLSTRARKDVKEEDIKVQVILQPFDILFKNGESLLKKPLAHRREALYETFSEIEGRFAFAKHTEGNTEEVIQDFLAQSVKDGCEGLMVKTLYENATYEPSERSLNWLKLKKDYIAGCGDTLDLVPIGAWYGKGKRTGVYGAYLLACYDDESEEYQTVCKVGTGFSDELLTQHTEFLNQHVIPKADSTFSYLASMECDVWFNPAQVWEVKCADLSISPAHTAASGRCDESKGIALRFPRFIRIRDDKGPDQATTASQVADMYENQSLTKD